MRSISRATSRPRATTCCSRPSGSSSRGCSSPKFRDADRWRETGVGILNREIGEQVYDDGMQYELDLHYHHESIGIFFKALQMMDANGYRGDFRRSIWPRSSG